MRPAPENLSMKQVFRRCPYRTVIGPDNGARTASEMVRSMSRTFAILGGDPSERIDADVARELVDVLMDGGTILILADRADLRDAAKAEIGSLCRLARAQAGGRA